MSWEQGLALAVGLGPLYVALVAELVKRRRENGNGDVNRRWNHEHAQVLQKHDKEVEELKKVQAAQTTTLAVLGERIEVLGKSVEGTRRSLHDLRNFVMARDGSSRDDRD